MDEEDRKVIENIVETYIVMQIIITATVMLAMFYLFSGD